MSSDSEAEPTRLMEDNKQVEQQVQLLTTVEENKSFYSSRQFERAKKARLLYHAVGTPSVKDFKTPKR